MNMKNIIALTLVFASTAASTAFAQTSGSQNFKITVPPNISITAPSNVTITHDQTENDQTFPAQQWAVKGNTLAGVNVTFATNDVFIHATDTSFKRNAQIGLAFKSKTGPATWSVTKASDVTDYAANDGVASVQATSNGVGRGIFDVTMKFVTDGFGSFAAGDYTSTVVGTVSSN
jgi:hypothetical protein